MKVEAGKRYRNPCWYDDTFVDVLYVDGQTLLVRDHVGESFLVHPDNGVVDWVEVEIPTPWPDIWLNIYTAGIGVVRHSREDADDVKTILDRIGLIHIKPDHTVEVVT